MNMITYGSGTAEDHWLMKTTSLASDYLLRCIEDLSAMLTARGDGVALGNAAEGKPLHEGSVEAWARDPAKPVGAATASAWAIADASATLYPR